MTNRYAVENLVFFDFESRSSVPLAKCGAHRYAREADAIIVTYAIGMGPVQIHHREGLALEYAYLPADLRAAFGAAQVFCAFNTVFDRAIWNLALRDSPWMAAGRVIDARATAMAHNLPGDLQSLSKRLGGPGKQADGRSLIAKFCGVDAVMPFEDPAAWERFCSYATQDTLELRRCFRLMLPALTAYDWSVYHASEQINDNGAGVDLGFCKRAAGLAKEEGWRIGNRLNELTEGCVTSVNQHQRIAEWVYDRLPSAEARAMMSIELDEDEDPPEDAEDLDLTVRRGVVERLLDYLRKHDCQDAALMEVLELREFGASAAPKKFQAILDRNVDGRVYGEFRFNGAGQTGRFTGQGVQLQNLTRTTLGKDKSDDYGYWEASTVDLIAGGCTLSALLRHGNGEVAARKLALTIRPAFCAPEGRTLVKADYAQVEARVLPWLSSSVGGNKLLASFLASDADPAAPDLYKVTAAGMSFGLRGPHEISKEERQTGKVAVLACGFGGGKNALHSMGAVYRMSFTDEEAQAIVTAWRAANPWAPQFWGKHTGWDGNSFTDSYGLMGAARRAIERPGSVLQAGRVAFIYVAARRDGMLLCILPSGRPLIYPSCRVRDYDIRDKRTKKVIETRHGLSFRRERGEPIGLYGGRFAENVTQAAAADLLRESLVTLVNGGHMVVSHSHDEIVVECDVADVERTSAALRAAMLTGHEWADGLPLAVDVTERWYYSAAKVPA